MRQSSFDAAVRRRIARTTIMVGALVVAATPALAGDLCPNDVGQNPLGNRVEGVLVYGPAQAALRNVRVDASFDSDPAAPVVGSAMTDSAGAFMVCVPDVANHLPQAPVDDPDTLHDESAGAL